ncbi:Crp-like helix-turn-helix domain-containing protein [Shimia gijangensis]|uniref:Crp-like helix-turn-helix domain-containing protein n=1 Tax=Shimia gijangensis TaxID=1470563 RepID=A0A1M6TIN9_9RHOB|nr:helix-turn-helix domain-containing protein [Shimia gijangensis]SHK56766.1 Crp-like helix-turn-helix domain-containing protein [Shimia gijangensis]
MIPSEDVREVFEKDTSFAMSIINELAGCYRGAIRNAKNIKLRTSVERLANYVFKHHVRDGRAADFSLPVEKKKLASFLGMTPENLSRALSALKHYGVEVSGQTIRITDSQALEAFAKPNALIDR